MTSEVDFIDDGLVNADQYPVPVENQKKAGLFKIAGQVTTEGEPARRRVRVLERKSGKVLASGFSQEDGTYEFTHLPPGEYIVYALDHTRTYNAAVADAVVAVPMEG